MAEWSRETSWRQGSILTLDFLLRLNPKIELDNMVAMVVTHDCDIAQMPQIEPKIEIIVGQYISQINGNFTFTKSPRKLHVLLRSQEEIKSVEFIITNKFSIDKMSFIDIEPDKNVSVEPNTLAVIKRWLGIRYTRFAFPDAFEERLKEKSLHNKIAKALKKHGGLISAIFFDVDEGVEINKTEPNDTYLLDIIILYATDFDPGSSEAAAESAKVEISQAFETNFFDKTSQSWTDIELRYCDVLSDEALTYKQSITLKQWRLEYISLAEDPPQPIIETN